MDVSGRVDVIFLFKPRTHFLRRSGTLVFCGYKKNRSDKSYGFYFKELNYPGDRDYFPWATFPYDKRKPQYSRENRHGLSYWSSYHPCKTGIFDETSSGPRERKVS